MLFPKEPTFVQNEVLPKGRDGSINPLYPSDNFCKSGHVAAQGSRFFHVKSPTLDKSRWGVYCETCLRIAHKLANRREQAKKIQLGSYN
jgi:hypothetical protein